ncbi:collagen alpha-2(I) chain-like [Prinia subflava]|uniref:collagen alpha-2(I) chain-like n=1 Tax=Prinia subflava TaxID=208062 RepID=UPI002FE39BC9
MYNEANTNNQHQNPSRASCGRGSLSPRAQFRARPAGALLAPGRAGRLRWFPRACRGRCGGAGPGCPWAMAGGQGGKRGFPGNRAGAAAPGPSGRRDGGSRTSERRVGKAGMSNGRRAVDGDAKISSWS